jgi:hypothetical protein
MHARGRASSDGKDVPTDNAQPLRPDPRKVQQLVDDLRLQLDIPQSVTVEIVPTNALMVSVRPRPDRPGEFLLSVEEAFLDLLSGDDLKAVVAHELGHVWIFTHHPYLQTEQLANEIAMHVVSREILEPVYAKVWKRLGTTGDLVRYLGDKPVSPQSGIGSADH